MISSDQAPELLPCPFCGSRSADIADMGHFWVSCDKCDAEGPTADTQIGAIEAWNTRPPSERPVAQVQEALVKKISAAFAEGKDCGGYDTLFDMLAHIALKVIESETLTTERPEAVREALEPFAKIADRIDDLAKRYGGNYTDAMTVTTTIGNCRAARAALTAKRPEAAVAQWQWRCDDGEWTPTAPPNEEDFRTYGHERFRPLYALQHEEPRRETMTSEEKR